MRSKPRSKSCFSNNGLVDIKVGFVMLREEFVYQNVYQFVYQQRRGQACNSTPRTYNSGPVTGITTGVFHRVTRLSTTVDAFAFR